MKFLKKLFVKEPKDFLEKGDNLLATESFYEARIAFEDGLAACKGKTEHDGLASALTVRIVQANTGLAALNVAEAEHALSRGAQEKASEHLILAISLTDDAALREKAERLRLQLSENTNITEESAPAHSCSSCTSHPASTQEAPAEIEHDLSALEYYELLILQLPEQLHELYSSLGEKFASMYIAASRDNHVEALDLLEKWYNGSHRDIYCYEKSKILHRLGNVQEAERMLLESIQENPENPLPHLGLALLLIDDGRFDEAFVQLERMIENDIFTGQALMMRGEVLHFTGNSEAAINQFSSLLGTPLGQAAAEKLYGVLLDCGRQADADHVFKKYLSSKCKH